MLASNFARSFRLQTGLEAHVDTPRIELSTENAANGYTTIAEFTKWYRRIAEFTELLLQNYCKITEWSENNGVVQPHKPPSKFIHDLPFSFKVIINGMDWMAYNNAYVTE